jgi:hypothetical protein
MRLHEKLALQRTIIVFTYDRARPALKQPGRNTLPQFNNMNSLME